MYSGGGDGYGGNDGGASQFAGGGFMPSTGGIAGSFSPGGSERKISGNTTSTGLLPVTIRQISKALTTDDNLIIDGQTVNNVTLVARILSKEMRSTDVQFTVDDGTGVVTVKQWIESDVPEERNAVTAIQVNTYVRIHGHFRSLNGRVSLQAFSIRPVTDHNEVTFHSLECIFVHLSNVQAMGGGSASSPSKPSVVQNSSAYQQPSIPNQYTNQYTAPVATGTGQVRDLQSIIQAIYDEPYTMELEAGLSYHEVAKRISGYSKMQIKETIDFLVNEGHLYSTIDEDHFKSTAC